MKILISPVGMQDPHGKPHKETKEVTEGSALAICRVVSPNRVILLPTQNDAGSNTVAQAEETRDWMEAEWAQSTVEILPVAMEAANDYEEAQRAYGEVLTQLAAKHAGAELFINASSGTPAIKLACLLAVAEGRITARVYYADDPTVSQRTEPVYELKVTFLRESSLIQRCRGLLAHGQFSLAQESLDELARSAFLAARRQWAALWKRLAETLQLWDERKYQKARGRLNKLIRDWSGAPAYLVAALEHQQNQLEAIATAQYGAVAWDTYFQAVRLQNQGHLTAAMEHLWIAVEAVTFERLERTHGEQTDDLELTSAIKLLLDRHKDATFLALGQEIMRGASVKENFHSLRRIRNEAVHRGKAATHGEVDWMKDLTQRWISALGSAMPTDYPMSPQSLEPLADLFLAEK